MNNCKAEAMHPKPSYPIHTISLTPDTIGSEGENCPQIMKGFENNMRSELREGFYTMAGAGMGCCYYAKHLGTCIEYIFLEDSEEQSLGKNAEIGRFVARFRKYVRPRVAPCGPFKGLLE